VDRILRPSPRTPKGAKPPYSIISKATPSIVPEAVREAIASAEDGHITKQARLRLKGEVAIRARQNVTDVEIEIYEDMKAENERCGATLKVLEPAVQKLAEETTKLKVPYVTACAAVPISPKESGAAEWGEDEPLSLEEIAAEKGLPIPVMVPDPKAQRWLMEYGVAASACMFSFGLQAIRGEEMDQIVQNPIPFLVTTGLSYGVTRMLGAGTGLIGLGGGDHVARASMESKRMRTAAMWIAFIAPLPLTFGAGVAIEAAVDGFGIHKSLVESASTEAVVHPSPFVVGMLSVLVAYPLFLFYTVKHFHYGYYRTLLAQLKLSQKKLRQAVKVEHWQALEVASAALMPKLKNLAEKEAEVADSKGRIRYELNETEINRLLDLTEKALSCDLELREEMGYEGKETKAKPAQPVPAKSPT